MNSQKVTANTQGQVKSADGAVLVKGEHYNVLRDDVQAIETATGANTAGVAANAAAIAGQYSGALTDGAPTDAELDAAIGLTPATAGAGFRCTVIDTDGTALVYLVTSDGTAWWYTVLTKAL